MVWYIEKFIKVKIKMLKIIVSYKSLEPWHWTIEGRLGFFSIFYEYKDPLISIHISIFLNIFLNHRYFNQEPLL